MTDFASRLFQLVCSQDPLRSFSAGTEALPCCQRCTGLYFGILATTVWWLPRRGWRWGLPPWAVVWQILAAIAVMVVFGFHWLDPGPRWRLASGLVYGQAFVLLVWPGAARALNRRHTKAWSRGVVWEVRMLCAALISAGVWLPGPMASAAVWTTILVLGWVAAAAGVLAALAGVGAVVKSMRVRRETGQVRV